MKLKLVVVLLLFFILFSAGCMAPSAPMRGIQGVKGDSGSSTVDVNYTFTGVPGTNALVVNVGNATDALLDFTIPSGANGSNLDTSWNLSYYLRDTSRSLTGGFIHRDVNNDYLSIMGGTGGLPYGGNLQLYGGSNVAQSGGAIFAVGNAAGSGSEVVWSVLGNTDNPQMSMSNNKIIDLLDPTNPQDAATKNYVDSVNASIVTGALSSTNPVALSAAQYVVGGPVNVFLRNDLADQMNTISTDVMLSTSNYSLSTSGAIKAYVDNKTSPSMLMNQTPNMTAGPTGPAGAAGGVVLYFNNTASDIAGYEGLEPLPAGIAEVDERVTVKSGLGNVLVDPYITVSGYPGQASLPAGLWRFRTYHYVSGASGTTNAVFAVYNRTAGGTETLLFTTTSDEINSLTVDEYLTSYVQPLAYPLALTDRIVIKVYGTSTHSSNIIFHFVYQGTTHTSHVQTPFAFEDAATLTFPAYAGSALYKGQAVYISGSNGGTAIVSLADNTDVAKSRVVGLMVADASSGSLTSVRRAGTLTEVDTRTTNLNINPLGQTWVAGDLLFATNGGGLTKVRPTSGRSVKAAYSMTASSVNGNLIVYPMENPVWTTAAANEGIVMRLGDSAGVTNISIRNYTNNQVARIDSYGNAYFNNTPAALVTGALTSTNPVALSAAQYLVGGAANVFLRNDQGLTMNEISSNSSFTVSNYSLWTTSAVKNYVTANPGINNSYYLRDNSLPLTSEKVKRDVDNDLLSLYGGDAIAGGTGIISLFGKTSGNPNAVEVNVGDAAGIGNIQLTGWKGGAAPRMDMNGYNITGIRTITDPTDAANKSYVDTKAAINESYAYLPGRAGGQVLTGSTSANGDLVLNGTSSSTKTSSFVYIQPDGGYATIGVTPGDSIPSNAKFTVKGGSLYLTSNGASINFTGGNNRITFSAMRAVEGTTTNARLDFGESYIFTRVYNNFSVGTSTRNATFTTLGSNQFKSLGAGTMMTDSLGSIYVVSDAKTKTDVKPYTSSTSALSKVNSVIPKTFHWSKESGLATNDLNLGFIAQELKVYIPEAVFTKADVKLVPVLISKGKTPDEDEYEQQEVLTGTFTDSVSDRALISVLWKAQQEEDAKVEMYKATIEAQQKEIDELKLRLDKAGIK